MKDVEKKVYNTMQEEVSSRYIGEMVMEGLKSMDEVAYIRFASVYKQFKDAASFLEEMQKMVKEEGEGKGPREDKE